MAAQKIVIRKYENRRLYDATHSRYVNLDDIAQFIREGLEIQVLDARTGEDLTRVILTQIIVENAKDRDSALPLDLLHQLVLASGRAGQEGFARYLSGVFDSYRQAYDAFQRGLEHARPPLTPLDFVQSFFPSAAPPAAAPERSEAEVEELRRRVEELERIVSRAKKKPASRRR